MTRLLLTLSLLAVLSAQAAPEAITFQQRCAVCHGADGSGVSGIYPRLRGRVTEIASSGAGRDYLMQVILFGLSGPITADEVRIDGVMPPSADLSDEQIAELLEYVIRDLAPSDGTAPSVSATDVARLRAQKPTPSMLRRLRQQLVTTSSESVTLPASTSRLRGAREDYVRSCQGCHGEEGCTDAAVVPPLKGAVGYFTRSEEGRAYLVEVPGVALSALSDERLARLVNWVLFTMSPRELVPDFSPYGAAEVRQLRAQALGEVTLTRARLVAALGDPKPLHRPRDRAESLDCSMSLTTHLR
jgi:mono/diheme cytochrome c family protein